MGALPWPVAPGDLVRVEFYKFPGDNLHYFWEAKVVEVRPEGILTLLPQGGTFHHVAKGRRVVLDHDAYVAFFPGAWYSGGPDVREGRVLEYYWNVQTPAEWAGNGFRQYDLELDVKCRADHTCQVFDREEFLAKHSLYPRHWVEEAEKAVEAIFRHMRQGRWPVLPPGEPLPWMERI
ncbi:DUF402 domain-containing protein [Thermus tengchongensis]|uniref:DUF402 domain-containing protein n=1 Tax=Thermus tengchongensis TaxID=1214928 RepID=A0ABY2K7L1_9DEIN|nr:DUF402 domain-containing protein [Thermus tengchongensis]TFU17036.1 DUF402 domain-containing protein [Thermus tengchongensis]